MCTCAKRKEKPMQNRGFTGLRISEFTQNSEFFRFSMADKSEELHVKLLAQKGKKKSLLWQDDSELDAASEEMEKRKQGSAQIGLNYANLEPGAEVDGNTFGPEYK